MPVINVLALSFKLLFLSCSLKIDLGPKFEYVFFSLCQLAISLISREFWKDLEERRGFPSSFQWAHLVGSYCLCSFCSQLLEFRQHLQHLAAVAHVTTRCPTPMLDVVFHHPDPAIYGSQQHLVARSSPQ